MLSSVVEFSEETYRDLSDYFRGAPIGLHLAGPDGTIARTNLAELELLGYTGHESEYIGHHLGEFHADPDGARELLDRLLAGEVVLEHEVTLVRRDGTQQRALLYANAKLDGGQFRGIRCCTFPHPDDLRPDIAEIAALTDQAEENDPDAAKQCYQDLQDFFENSPVSLHMVGGDGLIKHASRSELNSMGYDEVDYIGQHIARFHADQKVIDGMLEDLVNGSPLVNFTATLFHRDGSKLPVLIYSNSRMHDGSFVNTRCFTVPLPKARKSVDSPIQFAWPRNEDFGFTVANRHQPVGPPNPATLALKYIASRKRPEESLGFLASVSQVLGSARAFHEVLDEVAKLSVPFLADCTCIRTSTGIVATRSANAALGNEDVIEGSLAAAQEAASGADVTYKTSRTIVIPMRDRRAAHTGTLTLLRAGTPSQRDFGPADIALAEELARRISFAVELDTAMRLA